MGRDSNAFLVTCQLIKRVVSGLRPPPSEGLALLLFIIFRVYSLSFKFILSK